MPPFEISESSPLHSDSHPAFLFTVALDAIITPPEALSNGARSYKWPDESQDYWSQAPQRSAADAADVSDPRLDLIVGAAGLL